jgi:hypothetical protein
LEIDQTHPGIGAIEGQPKFFLALAERRFCLLAGVNVT